MPRLIINKGEEKGKAFDLRPGRNTIGRLAVHDVVLTDGSVSSNHADIFVEGGRLILHDLGSTNGTRVNAQAVTETELKEGDEIWFGCVSMRLECTPPKPPPRGGVKPEEIGVRQSPPPERVSSGFQKAAATSRREGPPLLLIILAALSVLLLILLAVAVKRWAGL